MTAPTRTRTPGTRARTGTRTPERRRQQDLAPSRTTQRGSPRTRSAAAERAYARRAQRVGRSVAREAAVTRSGTASRASFVVLIISLLTVGVAATLYFSTQAIADSYRLENATQAANDLAERAEILQREVMRKESPSALAQRARELGMVPGGNPARIVVGPDGKARVVGKPAPARAPAPPAPAEPPAPPENQAQPQQQGPGGGAPENQAQPENQRPPEDDQPAGQPEHADQQARSGGGR